MHQPWVASLVKTPSKLQFSFVPSSPSNTTLSQKNSTPSPEVTQPVNSRPRTAGDRSSVCQEVTSSGSLHLPTHSDKNLGSSSRMINLSNLIATPPHVKRKRDFERTFLESPKPHQDINGRAASSTPGEARIFHNSHQTNSILHGLNGQSWSRLQDQSFSLLAPNQSFGLEFSSPVGLRDWSIHHLSAPSTQMDDQTMRQQDAHDDNKVLIEQGHVTVKANQREQSLSDVQQPPDVNPNSPEPACGSFHASGNQSLTKDDSLFRPNPNQIAPLPHFSPFQVVESDPPSINNRAPVQLRCDESPLAFRTKKRESEADKVGCLAHSTLEMRLSHPAGYFAADQSQEPNTLELKISKPVETDVPDQFMSNHCRSTTTSEAMHELLDQGPPSHLITTADASIYATPDVSFSDDEYQALHAESESQNLFPRPAKLPLGLHFHQTSPPLIQRQDAPLPDSDDGLLTRCRDLFLLSENLKEDLSLKNQVIRVLETERDEGYRNHLVTQKKLQEIADRVQDAVVKQNIKRDEQAQKIASLVQDLASELDHVLTSCKSADLKKIHASSDEAHRFQSQLQSGKGAIEKFQQKFDSLINSDVEVQTDHFQQARGADANENGIAILSKQKSTFQHHLSVSKDIQVGNPSSQSQHSQFQAKELQVMLDRSEQAHSTDILRLKTEIENLTQKLNSASIQEESEEYLKDQVRMLEGEAKNRLEAMSELRSQSHGLQQELMVTKKSLDSSERSRSAAHNEIKDMRKQLESLSQKHFSESQAQLAKLTEAHHGFKAERIELMSRLTTKERLIEELRAELERLKSEPCKKCESQGIQVAILEKERDQLQKKVTELNAQSINDGVEITRLRKARGQLKNDIAGLNMALEAKQQENSYLKRHPALQQLGLNSSSLRASVKTASGRAGVKVTRPVAEGKMDEPSRNLSSPSRKIHRDDVIKKPSLNGRPMLSSITNISRRRLSPEPAEVESIEKRSIDKPRNSFAEDKSSTVRAPQKAIANQHEQPISMVKPTHEPDQWQSLPFQGIRSSQLKVRRTASFALADNQDHRQPNQSGNRSSRPI